MLEGDIVTKLRRIHALKLIEVEVECFHIAVADRYGNINHRVCC